MSEKVISVPLADNEPFDNQNLDWLVPSGQLLFLAQERDTIEELAWKVRRPKMFQHASKTGDTTAKIMPLVEAVVDAYVPTVIYEIGAAPGNLSLSIAKRYPDIKVEASSIKPTKDDHIGFMPGGRPMNSSTQPSNLEFHYADAITFLDERIEFLQDEHRLASCGSPCYEWLIVSDIGVNDIHKFGEEKRFFELMEQVCSRLNKLKRDFHIPSIIKMYTPSAQMWALSEYATSVTPTKKIDLMEMFGGTWIYKPYGSKSTNREIYMTYSDFASMGEIVFGMKVLGSSAENGTTARLGACYVWQTQALLDKYMGIGQYLSLPRLAMVDSGVKMMHLDMPVFDGDELVTWPDEKRFWRSGDYTPYESRNAMQSSHMADLFKVLDSITCIILMNTGIDFAESYIDHIAGVVLVPTARIVYMAAERRIQAGASIFPDQPTEAQANIDAQEEYEKWAIENHKDVLEDFFEITRPGLYLAAAGTGKSSFVKWATGQTNRNTT